MPTLVAAILKSRTGIAKDNVVNNFVFDDNVPVGSDPDSIRDAIVSFYNDSYEAGIDSIASRLSSVLDRTANVCVLKMYDITGNLDGSPHGSPVAERSFTLDAAQAGHNNLPAEVALACTFEADLTDVLEVGPTVDGKKTKPRARRRGRVFLGPLNDFARSQDGADGRVTVNASFLLQVGKAAQALINTAAASATMGNLVVWSRTDAAVYEVVKAKVDNELDTIRRRGHKATVRTAFNAA